MRKKLSRFISLSLAFLLCMLSLIGCGAANTGAETDAGPEEVSDKPVYALLYDDGTMVFQYGDTPESGKTVLETFEVDLASGYGWPPSETGSPWYDVRESIEKVRFADKIQPTSTAAWFLECANMSEFDGTNLDTSMVTDMNSMFAHCNSLKYVDVTSFDTSRVNSMQAMFLDCSSLLVLDLSSFDTSNVVTLSYMFGNIMVGSCRNLSTIYASERFIVPKRTSMFFGCQSLAGFNGTHCRTDEKGHDSSIYARIDNPPDAPGYFTYKAPPA